jgi:hypothetical protein
VFARISMKRPQIDSAPQRFPSEHCERPYATAFAAVQEPEAARPG